MSDFENIRSKIILLFVLLILQRTHALDLRQMLLEMTNIFFSSLVMK